MKSLRLKRRNHNKSRKLKGRKFRKGGNGRSSSSSSSSENYTNEKFDELINLLSQFDFMSDEDITNNTFGFNARKLQQFRDERAVTINEIKDILTNPNFNIALLPNYKTASLLTAIVSANDEIIDLYTNLYATKENPPQIDEVIDRVKFTFKMNTDSYDDDDDSNSDSERENKEKATSIANERYDKLISITKKMKGKRTRDDSSSSNSNKLNRRNEDTDEDTDDDDDIADLNTVFNNLKSKGGRRSRKLTKGRKLRRTIRRK
jgi:hypothetical protein